MKTTLMEQLELEADGLVFITIPSDFYIVLQSEFTNNDKNVTKTKYMSDNIDW